MVDSKLEDGRVIFVHVTEQWANFSLRSKFMRKDVFACFSDLEKAHDSVFRDKLRRVLQEYGINEHLLMAIKSLYSLPEVCIRVIDKPLVIL